MDRDRGGEHEAALPSRGPPEGPATPAGWRLDEVAALAENHYGLHGTLRELTGERDQNVLIESEHGSAWVVKIAPAGEAETTLALEVAILERLAGRAPPLPVPRVVPDRTGRRLVTVEDARAKSHVVRVLTYLAGEPLVAVRPHSPELLEEIGGTVARVDRALFGWTHDAMRRRLEWDLAAGPSVIEEHRHRIHDAARQQLVDRLLKRFDRDARPRLDRLRRSVIHNDANDHNLVVCCRLTESGAGVQRVVGLIDFGDALWSHTINGLAIAAAYAMLDKADPLAAAACVTRGYHAAFPIPENEIDALWGLIGLRLAVSVLLSARARDERPDRPDLRVSEAPAWRLIERLAGISGPLGTAFLRDACGRPPGPKAAAAVTWLQDHVEALGPLVEDDARQAVVLDQSLQSPWCATLGDAPTAEQKQRAIAAQLAASGASMAVSRHGEARLHPEDDPPPATVEMTGAARTIHLGVDLFVAAGTPILAPLEGRVQEVETAGRRGKGAPSAGGRCIVLRHQPDSATVFETLYSGLDEISLEHHQRGGIVRRGEVIGRVAAGTAGTPPHLHLQLLGETSEALGGLPRRITPAHRSVWLALCPDPNLLLRIPADRFPREPLPPAAIQAARAARIGPSLSVAYQRPLTIVRGRGAWLFDERGQAFLDCVNNVCHVGHAHPRVVRAASRQMALLNTNTRYLHELLVRYAERLTALLPDPLDTCFFVCTGSEANELALRLARAHTGGRDLIVLDGAYHGNTQGLIDISPYKCEGPGGRGLPDHVHKTPAPDPYRGLYRDAARAGAKYAEHVRSAARAASRDGRRLAAFIAEAMLGCGGQIVPPDGFLEAAYHAVREAGGVCIADEVQVGFGRPGSRFWAFELHRVVPDIVTMGKPIGNGHPLAAVVTTREIAASFDNGMEYFNTFGGNPVSCAVGLAVLDVIEGEGLQRNAREVGQHLLEGLRALQERHALIGDVRGRGLFIGVELVSDRVTREPAPAEATYVVERLRELGILMSTDGPDHNVLKIKPPLVFSTDDADRVCRALAAVLSESCLQDRRPAGK